jgi:hypothetical protein
MQDPSSLVVTSARAAAREEACIASVGGGQGAPVDPDGFDPSLET